MKLLSTNACSPPRPRLESSFLSGLLASDQDALNNILRFARNQDLPGWVGVEPGGLGVQLQAVVEGSKRLIGCCQAHSDKLDGFSRSKARNGSD